MKTSNKEVTFDQIEKDKLFILPGTGVCRKTGHVTATDKQKKQRVVYPKDTVALLNHGKK